MCWIHFILHHVFFCSSFQLPLSFSRSNSFYFSLSHPALSLSFYLLIATPSKAAPNSYTNQHHKTFAVCLFSVVHSKVFDLIKCFSQFCIMDTERRAYSFRAHLLPFHLKSTNSKSIPEHSKVFQANRLWYRRFNAYAWVCLCVFVCNAPVSVLCMHTYT